MIRAERKKQYVQAINDAAKQGVGVEIIRELCKKDLFFLLVNMFGRKDVDNDWLFDRCAEVQASPDGHLDLWARGYYKDLANDTPMLTANRGWTTHGNLKKGDVVFNPDGDKIKVEATTKTYTDSKCYRIRFNDHSEITAGAGHEWVLRRRIKHRTAPYSDIRWNEFVSEIKTTEEMSVSNKRMDVGCIKPLKYKKQTLPINPYLLGCWLGDGTSSCANITCSYADIQIIEEIRLCGIKIKENISLNENSGIFAFGNGIRGKKGTGMWPLFRKLKLKDNKHIPKMYMEASIDQRLELLRGLMDTDGSCDVRGHAIFCQKRFLLANQVCDLANGLGLNAKLRKYTTDYKGEPYTYYQVGFLARKAMNPFKLKRKAIKAKKDSYYYGSRTVTDIIKIGSIPTKCIQVEGGKYLAGKDLIPTHNSSIITYAKTIQDILINPSVTVGIFSHTRPIAKAFLRQIKFELETNQRLKEAFPEILYQFPHKDSPKWSEDTGITVKRPSPAPKEATVEAWGLIEGMPISKHFDIRVYDDVVTEKSVTTPEMIEKTTKGWELSLNLGSQENRERYIGTYYHFGDTYREIERRNAAIVRKYPATEDGTITGKPVLLSKEELIEKRTKMSSYVFACQMLLDPVATGKEEFKSSWLKYWPAQHYANLNVYILCDPANSKKKYSDYTAIFVIGIGQDGNLYIIDMVRDRLNLRERTATIFSLHRQYRPLKVGIERYGKDADIEHYEEVMERENYRFNITELGGKLSKEDRIRRLIPDFEAGKVYLPDNCVKTNYEGKQQNLTRIFVDEEYNTFPVSLHDDMIDCLARCKDPDFCAIPKPNTLSHFTPRRKTSRAA